MATKTKGKNRDFVAFDQRVMRGWSDAEFEELRVFLGISLSREQLLGRGEGAPRQLAKPQNNNARALVKAEAS